ncbi:unnamed protein product, partial [Mesorhabditis spiculigera]
MMLVVLNSVGLIDLLVKVCELFPAGVRKRYEQKLRHGLATIRSHLQYAGGSGQFGLTVVHFERVHMLHGHGLPRERYFLLNSWPRLEWLLPFNGSELCIDWTGPVTDLGPIWNFVEYSLPMTLTHDQRIRVIFWPRLLVEMLRPDIFNGFRMVQGIEQDEIVYKLSDGNTMKRSASTCSFDACAPTSSLRLLLSARP